MIRDNNYAIIKSLPDESGKEQMTDFISSLAQRATQSHEEKVKYQFLMTSLTRLSVIEKSQLPGSNNRFFTTLEIDVDGQNYSKRFELIKDLRKQPIYELRINIREYNWRFRAIFFPKYHGGTLYYCFTFPFLKYPEKLDPTNEMRDRTLRIYQQIKIKPENYFDE